MALFTTGKFVFPSRSIKKILLLVVRPLGEGGPLRKKNFF